MIILNSWILMTMKVWKLSWGWSKVLMRRTPASSWARCVQMCHLAIGTSILLCLLIDAALQHRWNEINYSMYTSFPQKIAFKKWFLVISQPFIFSYLFSFFFPLGFEPPQASAILHKDFSPSGPGAPICFGADDSLVSSCSHQAALSPAVLQNFPVLLEHYL